MSARDAAHRMGVKVETLYAYVSRGLLTRATGPDGRSSVFDAREVEALARRGRPRQSSRSTSLNMLIETRLTELTPQGVRYRGVPAAELAAGSTFEQVAELLWLGTRPDAPPRWTGAALPVPAGIGLVDAIVAAVALASTTPASRSGRDSRSGRTGGTSSAVGAAAGLPERPVLPDRDASGAGWSGASCSGRDSRSGRTGGTSSAVGGAAGLPERPVLPDRDAVAVAEAGRWLIASAVASLPAVGSGPVPRLVVGERPIAGTIAGRLWTRLSPGRPPRGMLAVLNAALVLLADHDLAASTFGVRVAASTRAAPAACVSAGLGVLRGPLHGGASALARAVLEEASAVGAVRAVGDVLRNGKRVPGFGHKVYTDADPRATVLLGMLAAAEGGARTVHVVEDVRAATMERTGQAANVDLALAAIGLANGMPADAGEVIMATARMAGWLAHVVEEYGEAPLRFRPRASYIG